MWGRLETYAPIGNRRKPHGLTTLAQDAILPHKTLPAVYNREGSFWLDR
jgi:hypothetical protein